MATYVATARLGASPFQEEVLTAIPDLRCREHVVLKTSRGTESGVVVAPSRPLPADAKRPETPRVLRRAGEQDRRKQLDLDYETRIEAHRFALGLIAKLKLPMHLVYVEHLLGHERLYFYFVSETRVDFRALVRALARRFRTRIEMRQIGAREAVRFLGDYQNCGQRLCCKAFLREPPPVPMSMARLQQSSVDPGKVSGQCGKIKCCMRYEHEVYEELRNALPGRGARVISDGKRGEVLGVDVYNQKVFLRTEEGLRISADVRDVALLETARDERAKSKSRKPPRGGRGNPPSGSPGPEPDAGPRPQPGGPAEGEGGQGGQGGKKGSGVPGVPGVPGISGAPAGLLACLLRLRSRHDETKVKSDTRVRVPQCGSSGGGCGGCATGRAAGCARCCVRTLYRSACPARVMG